MAGSEINITVKSKDLTGPGAKSARKNLEGVGDIAKGVLASQVFDRMGQAAMRGLKSTFNAEILRHYVKARGGDVQQLLERLCSTGKSLPVDAASTSFVAHRPNTTCLPILPQRLDRARLATSRNGWSCTPSEPISPSGMSYDEFAGMESKTVDRRSLLLCT